VSPEAEKLLAEAVREVAPSHFEVYEKLLSGAYARVDLAERRVNELASELAELKQRVCRSDGP
jgi:hypothetical protein